MSILSRLRRRHARLDARVEDARQGAERAAAEVQRSRERGDDVRARVVRPLSELADQNHFALVIRESLIEGRGQ